MPDYADLFLKIDSTGAVTASKSLDELAAKGEKAEKATKKVTTASDAMSAGLRKMAALAATAFAGFKLIELAKESALLAARYETLGASMVVVGNNAGYSTAQMDSYEASLRKTGIAMIESRTILTRMAQAQIDLSKSSELARVAQDAAVIGGINSSEAFERMIHGIQSGQVEILRGIGINVNFENSYKKLAAELGKTAASLTETEKMQARTNVVMQAGAGIAGTYEASMNTAGKQLLSMQRYSDDLKVKMGAVFNDILIVGVQTFTGALKSGNAEADRLANNRQLEEWGKNIVFTVAGVADAVAVPFKVVNAVIETVMAGAIQANFALEAIFNTLQGRFDQAKMNLSQMAGTGDLWAKNQAERFSGIGSNTRAATSMYADRAASAEADKAKAAAAEQLRLANSAIAKSAKEAADAETELANSSKSLLETLLPLKKEEKEYAETLVLLNKLRDAGTLGAEDYATAIKNLTEGTTAFKELAEAEKKAVEEQKELGDRLEALKRQADPAYAAVQDLAKVHDDLTKSLNAGLINRNQFDELYAALSKVNEVGKETTETLEAMKAAAENIRVTQLAGERLGIGTGGATESVSGALMAGAGGVDKFLSSMDSFVDKFFETSSTVENAADNLGSVLGEAGFRTIPATREAMWSLMQTLDAGTDAGRRQINALLSVTDMADRYYSGLEKQAAEALAAQKRAAEEQALYERRIAEERKAQNDMLSTAVNSALQAAQSAAARASSDRQSIISSGKTEVANLEKQLAEMTGGVISAELAKLKGVMSEGPAAVTAWRIIPPQELAMLRQMEANAESLRVKAIEEYGEALRKEIAATEAAADRAEQAAAAAAKQEEARAAKAAAAAEKARAIAEERLDLENKLLEMQGITLSLKAREFTVQQTSLATINPYGARTPATSLTTQTLSLEEVRKLELAALDSSNRALQVRIWALEDEEARLAKLKVIADERAGLERRLLEVQGNTEEIRRQELAGLDVSNRALQLRIWAIEDEKNILNSTTAAAATRNALIKTTADERAALERELLVLNGDTIALRALELDALQSSNRGLQITIWAMEDKAKAEQEAAKVAAAAAAEAERVADERSGLERQLLEIYGDTAAIRQLELSALDSSNRAMQERIWGLQDEQKAREKSISGMKENISSLSGAIASLSAARLQMSGGMGFGQALTGIRGITSSVQMGDAGALKGLDKFLSALTNINPDQYRTAEEFQADQNRALMAMAELEKAAGIQQTAEERMVGILELQLDALTSIDASLTPVKRTDDGMIIATQTTATTTTASTGGDTAAEIRALRAELKAALYQIAKNTSDTTTILEDFDANGMPDVRVQ